MQIRQILVVIGVVALVACGDDDGDEQVASTTTTSSETTTSETTTTAAEPDSSRADDQLAIEETLNAIVEAEKAGDAEGFLDLVTDSGLEAFEYGSREEILAGTSGFGEDPAEAIEVGDPEIDGDTAVVSADIKAGLGLYRLDMALVRDGDRWLVDGFEFLGSPPPGPDTSVVEIMAGDYAFTFDRAETTSGDFAIKFINNGTNAHEMSLFEAPAEATVPEAQAALANVDGSSLENVPEPYQVVDHLTFAEPGQEMDFVFFDPLPPGHYFVACFIPEGVRSEADFETATGKPHIQLGMIADFTVG